MTTSMRIFTLITNEIVIQALKTMRQIATGKIWSY